MLIMTKGTNAVLEFYRAAKSKKMLDNEQLHNISISYKYEKDIQIVNGCNVSFDLWGNDCKISIIDSKGKLRFIEYYPRWQDFTYDENTCTLRINGIDNKERKNIPYTIVITI